MGHTVSLALEGDVLTVQPYALEGARRARPGQAFLLEVSDESASRTLLASLPLLDRLLAEKIASVRQRRLEEMVDFMAARMLAPSVVEQEMAQRIASRHARLLNEFGY